MAMLSLDEKSKRSVYDDTNDDFCQPFSNNVKIHILVYVQRNIPSTSQVVMAADRNKISSNTLNDIIASIIRESQGCEEDFVFSKMSTSEDVKNFVQRNLSPLTKTFWLQSMILTLQHIGMKNLKSGKK